MPTCLKCNTHFSINTVIDGKKRNLCNRKFCLTCSPFGLHNTRSLNERNPLPNGNYCTWHVCQKPLTGTQTRFCSINCNSKDKVTNRRRELKQLSIAYKGGSCARCGYSKCVSALEFHHLDPNVKDFNPSQGGHTRSWERTKQELDKCVMVCANCHREIHQEIRLETA